MWKAPYTVIFNVNLKFSSFLWLWHFFVTKVVRDQWSLKWQSLVLWFAALSEQASSSHCRYRNYMPSNSDNSCLLKFSLSVLYMSCFSCCIILFLKNCSEVYLHGCFFQMAISFFFFFFSFSVWLCICRKEA